MSEREAQHEFGYAARVQADAIGEPGQRQFRLLVESPAGSACLWMEKEQLYGMALAIHRLLATMEESGQLKEGPLSDIPVDEGGATSVEFKVANLALGHAPESSALAIMAYDQDTEEEGPATLRCWAMPDQLRELAEEALRVCSAGRPLCPLCHGPINPEGHLCPKVNGHSSLEAEEE